MLGHSTNPSANTVGGQCGWVCERLSQFVRGTLGQRAAGKIDSHVPSCASCSGALAQAQQVNSKLAALVVPILLVGVVKGVKGGLVLGGARRRRAVWPRSCTVHGR